MRVCIHFGYLKLVTAAKYQYMMQLSKLTTIIRLLTRLSLVYCVFTYWQLSDAYSRPIYPEGKASMSGKILRVTAVNVSLFNL